MMRRLFIFLLLLTAATLPALAQQTAVTATVKDANGNLYANCRYSVDFVNNSTVPLINSSVRQTSYAGEACTSSGTLAITLWDNNAITVTPSQWKFNICDQTNTICFTCPITVTGASMDITSNLQSCSSPLNPASGFANISVTGGTINGTPIGGTTPAAGAFTTSCSTLQPTVNVKCYGALGNGKATTHAVANGTTTLTDADGPWVAADVGKTIVLYGGAATSGQVTTIAAFVSSSQITLNAASSFTGTVNAAWGTLDDTAIQAAVTAITPTSNGSSLYFPPGIYLISQPIVISNSVGLTVSGAGASNSASLGNVNASAQDATGTAIVWAGAQGGFIGCTGNTGLVPAGVDNAAQTCSAAENFMMQVSGSNVSVHDLSLIGSQLVSHDLQMTVTAPGQGINFHITGMGIGYAFQYGIVVGGTASDPSTCCVGSLDHLILSGNGQFNSTAAEADPTGGGDIFLRYGNGNFQLRLDTLSFSGGYSRPGTHHIYHYNGQLVYLSNIDFEALNANGVAHSSIYDYKGGAGPTTLSNIYNENGWLLHQNSLSGGNYVMSNVVNVQNTVTTAPPHIAAQFDGGPRLVLHSVYTSGLPLLFTAGGASLSIHDLEEGGLTPTPAPGYQVNNCSTSNCITSSAGVVTLTTATAHSFLCTQSYGCDWIQVSGAANAAFNGTFKIASIISNTQLTYGDAAATGSTQGGTIALACCAVATAGSSITVAAPNPFTSINEFSNGSASADTFSAITTNLMAKNSIVYVPQTWPGGSAGIDLPSTIPAGWNFLDFRSGNPTYIGGPFQWGTNANYSLLGVNNSGFGAPDGALFINVPAALSALVFPALDMHVTGSGAQLFQTFSTDSGGSAEIQSVNGFGGAAWWQILMGHGTPPTFNISSINSSKTYFSINDTTFVTTVGASSGSTQLNGLISGAGVAKLGNTALLTADSSGITATTPGTIIFTLGTMAASTNYAFHCSGTYSQATAAAANGVSIQGATNAPTRIDAHYNAFTSNAGAAAQGNLANLTSTTQTALSGTFTPSASATVFNWSVDGVVQNGASATTLKIGFFTGSASDALTIKAGSYCTLLP